MSAPRSPFVDPIATLPVRQKPDEQAKVRRAQQAAAKREKLTGRPHEVYRTTSGRISVREASARTVRERYPETIGKNPGRQQLGVGGPVEEVVGNLAKDAVDASLGFVPGLVGAVRHPVRAAKQTVAGVKWQYGPLVHGDVGTAARRAKEHPLAPLLDAFTVASAGVGAGARVARIGVPLERRIALEGGAVQPVASPNTLTRMIEHRQDRFAEANPDAPHVGARAVVKRRLPYELQREHERAVAPAIELQAAAKKLSGPEKVAYSVIADYGDKAPQFIDREIAMREKRMVDHPTEANAQAGQITMLRKAREHVAAPSPQLATVATLGRRLSELSKEKKIAMGQLTEAEANDRINLHARLVEGATFEKTAARKARPNEQVRIYPKAGASVATSGDFPQFSYEVSGPQVQRRLPAREGRKATSGFVGAGDVQAGEGAFYTPDAARPAIKSAMARTGSVLGKPRKIVHQTQGVLFAQGRHRRGPKLTVEDFARAARAESQARDIERARTFSRPLNPQTPNGLDEGHTFFNPDAVKLPRRLKESPSIDEIAAMSTKELEQALHDEHAAIMRSAFPTEADVANLPPQVREKVRQIDQRIVHAFAGHRMSLPSGPLARGLLGTYDFANNVMRTGLLFLKGGYVPANFVSDLGFLAIQQGPLAAINLIRATGKAGIHPETLRHLDLEVGNGPSLSLAENTSGPLGALVRHLAHGSNIAASLLTRRAAILHELAARGFKSDEQINALLHDQAQRPLLNQIGEQAENAIVRYRGLSPDERAIVARAVFPYGWVKGSTRFAMRLPLDRPAQADLAVRIGAQGSDESKQILGHVVSYLENLIPLGPAEPLRGTLAAPVTSGSSVTPFGTFADVLRTMENVATGKEPTKQLSAFAAPPLRGALDAATGFNSFQQRPYPPGTSPAKALYESTLGGVPAVRLADDLVHPKFQAGDIQGTPMQQPLYLPPQTAGEARTDAVKRFLLPNFLNKRDLNVTAAQARGEAEARSQMSSVERAAYDVRAKRNGMLETIKKYAPTALVNGHLPAPLEHAYRARARRAVTYARLGIKRTDPDYQRHAYLADVDMLAAAGAISGADITAARRWAQTAKPREIARQRAVFTRKAFGGDVISYARSALNRAGAELP